MSLDIFVWAIIGGVFVAILSSLAMYYNQQPPNNKQLSRDFLIGAIFTGFLFPLIPESFNEIQGAITSTAADLQTRIPISLPNQDPGVQVGPANF